MPTSRSWTASRGGPGPRPLEAAASRPDSVHGRSKMHKPGVTSTAVLLATMHFLAVPLGAVQPEKEELALRDRWVQAHFPLAAAGMLSAAPAEVRTPALLV